MGTIHLAAKTNSGLTLTPQNLEKKLKTKNFKFSSFLKRFLWFLAWWKRFGASAVILQ